MHEDVLSSFICISKYEDNLNAHQQGGFVNLLKVHLGKDK